MLRVGVLVSGGGTNLQAIIDAVKSGDITNASIEVVISNKKDAYALTRAKENGIAAESVCIKDFESREKFNDALIEKLSNMEVLDEASAKAMLKEIQKEHGIKGKNLFMGSKISLTGQMHGPDLNKIMEVIGKETCLKRLAYVKNNIL